MLNDCLELFICTEEYSFMHTPLPCRVSEMSAAKKAFEKEKRDEINHLTRELQEKRKALDGVVERNQALADEIVALRSRQADLNQV